MLHLFKEKRYRPLGILMLCLFAYLIVAAFGMISVFTGQYDTMKPVMKWFGMLVNLYCLVFCISNWRIAHKESIQREQEWKKRYSELGVEYEPQIDYQKSRRQNGWMWTLAIAVNLFCFSTYFW